MTFTRKITFAPAFDKRDPNPSKNYGIHGAHITFSLKEDGVPMVLTFSVSTNWQLPHVQAEMDAKVSNTHLGLMFHKPMAFGVDLHKPDPEGIDCSLIGCKCMANGSALLGEEFLQILIAEGDEGLWARMEKQYLDWTNDAAPL